MTNERNTTIRNARRVLESRTADAEQTCRAIAELGKPYDERIIGQSAPLVATYLKDTDFLVRYQAIWFLGSWGHLSTYASEILAAAESDSDVDNRAFAAKSLGSILKHNKDRFVTVALLRMVDNQLLRENIRLSAYAGLLHAWNRPGDFDFLMGDQKPADFDRRFLDHLRAWTDNKDEMPSVTPRPGLLRSVIHFWRINRSFQSTTSSTSKSDSAQS